MLPRVVWAEESKNGLRFEFGPSYDVVPTRYQLVTHGVSSCMYCGKIWALTVIVLRLYISNYTYHRLNINRKLTQIDTVSSSKLLIALTFALRSVQRCTAGLPIRWTLGHCHTFFCRGPILKPRPVLDSPDQTTRGKVLNFFVKPQNGLVTLVFEKRCFPGVFRDKSGPLS